MTAASETIVEIERAVATVEDRVMPYFWVHGGDHREFEDAFRAADSVTNITAIDAVDDARLCRVEWTQNVETIVYAYVEVGATILRAIRRDENWELRIRFDDHENLAALQTYCEENEIGFELDRVTEQEQPMAGARYDLTPKRRDTLVTALEADYYDVPREVTMSDLADEVDITQRALSKRFHGGHENLITSTLTLTPRRRIDVTGRGS